jgi:hypothetical protein
MLVFADPGLSDIVEKMFFLCVNCVDFFPFYFLAFLNSENTEKSPPF